MTRLNVYAGPAGFYIIRGGPDIVLDSRFGTPAVLPGPAPRETDQFPPNKTYYEIPMAIQVVPSTPTDRSSTPTRGRSSTAPKDPTFRTPTSRRSGIPNSSAT